MLGQFPVAVKNLAYAVFSSCERAHPSVVSSSEGALVRMASSTSEGALAQLLWYPAAVKALEY